MTAKYAFIASEEGNHSVASMCRWSKVSRSGYYAWRDREPSATARRREALEAGIRSCFEYSDGTYGYRRVHAELARRGTVADPGTVRTIMRGLGLVACQPRPWRPVTTVAGDTAALPDLVRRDFTADAPAAKLVGDITYIRTWEGWLYLATVLDCHSKKVVGYAMADHLRTELVTDALRMAARNLPFRRGETIFHSDRGTQYLSAEFAALADELGVRRSVGRTGNCYDNAWAESFNGTLKNERVNRTEYPTREHARKDVTGYIELRYNQIRIHSGIDYRTPNEVESAWFSRNQAA
ncbi:transposase InsO family protein [Saccharothrix variisporea]|uniref:Transposase InsO family protein n=2 Tax=Saccharothrix variisporea TaxID=543527 RepID=A0A495XFU7_9PSEU|nr:transposase InsO family protein [Saccharothrix variisporea]RKT74911.1 transposase InsO family protein [Saccharothrix variisporea]